MRLIDVLSSIPTMLLYILMMVALGAGFGNIIIAMALTGWIEPPTGQPSDPPPGSDLLVAVYGMSFSANNCASISSLTKRQC